MSVFRVNGVELTYVRTLRFHVGSEADPSGVDQLWRVYDLSVQGVVSGGTEITNGPAALASLVEAVTSPRKSVYYQMGDTVLFNTAGVDARYGPDPPTVQVDTVVPGVILATVSLKVRVASCANNPGSNEIASLRWSQTEEVDPEEQLTVLVTHGTLISRTDLRALNADSFREALPVPVPAQNFTRQSSYTLDETGTKLRFEFRDREWFKPPPRYATAASGNFTVSSNKPGGIRWGAASVTLKGGPAVPRLQLVAQAWAVAAAKVKGAGLFKDTTGNFIVEYMITEDLYRNIVQVNMRGQLGPVTMDAISTAFSQVFGDTPGSDDRTSIAPPVRRALGGLLSAAFKDPCATAAASVSQANSVSAAARQYPPASITSGPVTSLPDTSDAVYKPDRGGYEWYKCELSYHLDEGKGHLPGSGVGPTPNKAKIVKATGRLMTLEVAWSWRRRGVPGVSPAYQTGDPNLDELGAVWGPLPEQEVGADGAPVWQASGCYRYAVLDPDAVVMNAPRPPYLSELAASAITSTLKYADPGVFGSGTSSSGGGSAPGLPPVDPGAGGSSGSGPNPSTGSGVETQAQPDDSLARQLTPSEEQYVEQLVEGGGDRATITNLVLSGLAGPLGGSAPGIPPSGG